MTLSSIPPSSFRLHAVIRPFLFVAVLGSSLACAAQSKPAPNPAPDVLVLSNGDTLHGKFVNEIGGKVTFHTDPLGDVAITWDKIKELHTTQKFAVLDKTVKLRGKKNEGQIPVGTFDVDHDALVVHTENGTAPGPIPVKNAQYVIDEPTLNKQAFHEPNFFTGWNGAATAGGTLVTATQNQYTVSGAVGLVRVVPTVAWLNPRDRTSFDFNGSFGKITQPGYFAPANPPTTTTPTYVPGTETKSAITHVDAERDQFISARFFALAQTAFDHNFSQDLNLQQIYGGGFGYTVLKTPKQEADLKGTVQYEKQDFISGSGMDNQNLIGSTFAATYVLHLKQLTYTQGVSFIPAWNVTKAYTANEVDTVAFPAYKNFSFSLGTLDSYLNDPPAALPPVKRNSFQFTMGLTYAIKSKY
jgi:hypothetical protein